jgi:molybdenum-dependent DNA-binding transcriptional regulator ModE
MLIERDGARGSALTAEAQRLVNAFDTVSAELSEYAMKRLEEELA